MSTFVRWLITVVVFIFAFQSQGALAGFSVTCGGSTEAITIHMPPSISVPRDAAVGTPLTSWVTSAATTNFYPCTVTTFILGRNENSGMVFKPSNTLINSGIKVKGPVGEPYTVWNTNVLGVGVAIGVRTYPNLCDWYPWRDLGAPGTVLPPWTGDVCNNWLSGVSTIYNGGQVQVALIKTGPITPNTVTGSALVVGSLITDGSGYTVFPSAFKTYSISDTKIIVASCSTPNVNVNLGSYNQATFTGLGSTTPPVKFNVSIEACPAGLNSIQYQFIPVNAVVDAANGVLALSSNSTATGIGLQLKDGNGKALQYDTPYTLPNLSGPTGGAYTIPLTAAYYQTASSVTAGSANAILTFTMNYQ
ncbi:fimbrial protein [Burkholderia cepacia]|uniref:fimbrial protein n=1 Tax=Burkholderia cepacia TaxID=292 RepID=UPI002ABDD13D|nr:fimbrial protein [Burkholderia cepacia]